MAAPRFVHLRLHSEFSIVDGTVRVDDGIAAALADGMPALAVTDLANAFGLVKFYRAARARRHQAHHRLRRLADARGRARPAVPRVAARAVARRIPAARRMADARVSHQPAPRPRGIEARLVAGGHRRADRAVRRPRRRSRQLAAAGQRRAARRRRRAHGRVCFRSATTSKCSARAAPTTTRWWPRPCALAGELALPVVATHPVQFLRREDFRAHEARVCIAERLCPRRSAPAEAFHARPVFQDAGGDGGGVRRPSGGARELASPSRSAAT